MANNENFLSEYSRYLDSTGHHFTYAGLSAFRNSPGELSEKERLFFKNHLDSCSFCSARLVEVAEVEGDVPKVQPSMLRWMTVPAFRYSLAAILVVALGITAAYYLTRPVDKRPMPGQSIAAVPPNPGRFIANSALENLVGRTVRSASETRFLSPRSGDTLAAPFTFRWEGGKKRQDFTLTVVDNRNVEAWKGTTETGRLIVEKRLEPGLYYSKLEADGVLAQVGKFFVAQPQQ
jgi:hypothetical protein